MKANSFEKQMRALEYFHDLRLLPGAWAIVRVDGRTFSSFTETRYEKPYDEQFRDLMTVTAQTMLEELHGLYAYTQSDEISLLFAPEWDLFARSVEKIVSVSAGIASATFTHQAGEPAHFDSRVWLGVDVPLVIDYFRWRQADAVRNALNSWCYWTLRGTGMDVTEATHELEGKSTAFKNELLFQHGINFNDLPLWQRRGVGLYWERYEKEGYNPITQQVEVTTRRKPRIDLDLPMKEEYANMLQGIFEEQTRMSYDSAVIEQDRE